MAYPFKKADEMVASKLYNCHCHCHCFRKTVTIQCNIDDGFGCVDILCVFCQQLRGGCIGLLGDHRAELLRNVSGGQPAVPDPVGLWGGELAEIRDNRGLPLPWPQSLVGLLA